MPKKPLPDLSFYSIITLNLLGMEDTPSHPPQIVGDAAPPSPDRLTPILAARLKDRLNYVTPQS